MKLSSGRRRGFTLQIEGLERLQKSVLHGKEGGCRAGGCAGLDVDALDMSAGRLGADAQRMGDLAIGGAAGDEDQDLELPGRESGWSGSSLALALPGGRKDGVNRTGVEAAGSDIAPKLGGGLLGGHRGSVRARLGHRAIRAGDGQEPPCDWNGRPGKTAVIAGAVGALMCQRGDGSQSGEDRWTGEHSLGVVGVHPHPF